MGSAEVGWKNPAYRLGEIAGQAAPYRVTICWIGPPGLPAGRPDIATGLIYGHLERDLPWERASERLLQVKSFWHNRR